MENHNCILELSFPFREDLIIQLSVTGRPKVNLLTFNNIVTQKITLYILI